MSTEEEGDADEDEDEDALSFERLFLMGLDKYGKGDWRSISRNYVVSRTPTQVASHAQKYFKRLGSANKERRRSSIHDITSVGGDASTSQGPITGHTEESRDVRTEPSSQPPDVSTYVPPTIVESTDCSLISAVGTPAVSSPANLPFTPDTFYDIGALSPDSLFSGIPMDMASMTCL